MLVRLAQSLDVSVDYLVIDTAPRRPLTGPDHELADRVADLANLDPDDRDAILHILDGLIAKNRVRAALRVVDQSHRRQQARRSGLPVIAPTAALLDDLADHPHHDQHQDHHTEDLTRAVRRHLSPPRSCRRDTARTDRFPAPHRAGPSGSSMSPMPRSRRRDQL